MCETKSRGPILIDGVISENTLPMELDTGVAMSIISEDIYRRLCPNTERSLGSCSTRLTSYTGRDIAVVNQTEENVCIESQQ